MDGKTGFAIGALGMGCFAVAGAGVGIAAASGHTADVHGCVAAHGALRIVSGTKACGAHEKSVVWNQPGRRGPRGRPGTAPRAATFQMFASVDDRGNLGANLDAAGAADAYPGSATGNDYTVVFTHPIGNCAAHVQPGYSNGSHLAGSNHSVVIWNQNNPNAFDVFFGSGLGAAATAFMITVTCPTKT